MGKNLTNAFLWLKMSTLLELLLNSELERREDNRKAFSEPTVTVERSILQVTWFSDRTLST
jgi:hypothetical protein